MSIRNKIDLRMKMLQEQMENNLHLDDSEKVQETIDSVSKFWSAINFEDREYIQLARDALENKIKWNV